MKYPLGDFDDVLASASCILPISGQKVFSVLQSAPAKAYVQLSMDVEAMLATSCASSAAVTTGIS
jgi:hypothetical protein